MTERRQFCPKGHDTFIVGRDSSHRCLACKRIAMQDAYRRRVEQEAAEQAQIRHAEYLRARAEAERRDEREYQAAIKAGGAAANNARWDRAWSEEMDKTGRGLCQFEAEVDGQYMGRDCYTRPDGGLVYCSKHSRQSEREARREAKEAKR